MLARTATVHHELEHTGMTLELPQQEYKVVLPDGYQESTLVTCPSARRSIEELRGAT